MQFVIERGSRQKSGDFAVDLVLVLSSRVPLRLHASEGESYFETVMIVSESIRNMPQARFCLVK